VVAFPLSTAEEKVIRWASRIVPAAALAVIVLLGAMSVASTLV
jgi:hypothetical protein